MATSDYTAQSLLARPAFHSAIVQDSVPLDPSFKALPWVGIDGKSLAVPRLGRALAPQFLGVADAVPSGVDFSTASYRAAFPVGSPVEFPLKTIATDRPLDERIVRELSEPHLQEHYVVQAGTEAVLQKFCDLFVNGVSAGPDFEEFDGLGALVTPAQTAASSGNILFDLDVLLGLIEAGDGVPTAFLMPKVAERLFLLSVRGASSVIAHAAEHPVFGVRNHYCGIPILPNSYIPILAPHTSIYAVYFGVGTGLAGIHPARNGEMGVRVEKRHDDDEDTWYYNIRLECGLALYRETALAKIANLDLTPVIP